MIELIGSDWQDKRPKRGVRSHKKGTRSGERPAGPALPSAQKATDCYQKREIPQPLCQFSNHRLQSVILHEPAFAKAFSDMLHSSRINLTTPNGKEKS